MSDNIVRIRAVANGLKALNQDIFFVGGAVVELYASEVNTFEHRVTDDVDVILEVFNRGKYYLLQERLRSIGFVEDAESGVICRWKYQGITVDVMPLNEEILGFSNRWYKPAIEKAIKYDIGNSQLINILSYPYFLATKFEALNDRKTDWRYSKDFEDIVKSIEARPSFETELEQNSEVLKQYIITQLKDLIEKEAFLKEAMSTVLYPNGTEERINDITKRIKNIIK